MKKQSKAIALLLAVGLSFSMLYTPAFADETEEVYVADEADESDEVNEGEIVDTDPGVEIAAEDSSEPEDGEAEDNEVITSETKTTGETEQIIESLNQEPVTVTSKAMNAATVPDFWVEEDQPWQRQALGSTFMLNVIVHIDAQYTDILTYEWGCYDEDLDWVSLGVTADPSYTVESYTGIENYYCRGFSR